MKSKMRREEGAVLIIAILVLLAATVLGIASITTTGIDTRLTRNLRLAKINFFDSETALKVGYSWLAVLVKVTDTLPLTDDSLSGGSFTSYSSTGFDWITSDGPMSPKPALGYSLSEGYYEHLYVVNSYYPSSANCDKQIEEGVLKIFSHN